MMECLLRGGFGNVVYNSQGIFYEFSGLDQGPWAKMMR